jgi:uncharacterized protein YaaN involved in tellurite resistance
MTTDLQLNPNQELTPEEKSKIETYKNAINFNDSNQIIQYGAAAQNQLTSFADAVLSSVRSKDMGEIGEILIDLTADLKNFDSSTDRKGLFSSIKKRIARLQSEYSKVETNINKIELELSKHNQTLLKDIYLFDQQYQENREYFRELSLYIQAGEEKLKEMREVTLPEMQKEVQASNNMEQAQLYRDLEQQVTRFEKKIHDLKLSRTISIQLAPQIRMVQNNSATMIDKIQSTLVNTIPLWKNQMVLSLGLAHTQQALDVQKAVTDTTNELLKRNSEMLKQSTAEIAKESERGIVDIETIKKANGDLFQAMDDLLRIQAEGREKRIAAEVELKAAEEELKKRLLADNRK